MGRMETIKQRAIYVYVPSIEQKERWRRYAEKQGISISKFVVEYVENSLRQREEHGYRSREELWKENNELRQQVKGLERRKGFWKLLVDRLERELRRYRAKPFLEEEFDGVRTYEKELIKVLRSRPFVTDDQVLCQLGIDFLSMRQLKRSQSS